MMDVPLSFSNSAELTRVSECGAGRFSSTAFWVQVCKTFSENRPAQPEGAANVELSETEASGGGRGMSPRRRGGYRIGREGDDRWREAKRGTAREKLEETERLKYRERVSQRDVVKQKDV